MKHCYFIFFRNFSILYIIFSKNYFLYDFIFDFMYSFMNSILFVLLLKMYHLVKTHYYKFRRKCNNLQFFGTTRNCYLIIVKSILCRKSS